MPKAPTPKSPKSRNNLRTWLPRLTSTESPAVIEIPARLLKSDGLNNALHKAGFHVVLIDAPDQSPVDNKEALLRAIYRTRALPKHFGFNWDALVDSLSDLEQTDAKGYTFILRQPQTLKTQSPEDYATFIEVVQAVSARWARAGVPFKLVLPNES